MSKPGFDMLGILMPLMQALRHLFSAAPGEDRRLLQLPGCSGGKIPKGKPRSKYGAMTFLMLSLGSHAFPGINKPAST